MYLLKWFSQLFVSILSYIISKFLELWMPRGNPPVTSHASLNNNLKIGRKSKRRKWVIVVWCYCILKGAKNYLMCNFSNERTLLQEFKYYLVFSITNRFLLIHENLCSNVSFLMIPACIIWVIYSKSRYPISRALCTHGQII